jgi:hypothetical protein
MQKMLVGLVLVLTVAVGALGVAVLNLSDQIAAGSRRGAVVARKGAEEPAVHREEIDTLLKQVSKLTRELESVRADQRQTASALARSLARRSGSDSGPKGDGRIDDKAPDLNRPLSDPNFAVTAEDEAWYTAVKEAVDRKRRIKGQLTNTMRRIDRLASSGAINPVPATERAGVEKIVLNYVTAADDLLTRYVRKPSEELKALAGDQRREAMRKDRDEIVKEAERELLPILGDVDTQTIVERTLRSRRSWRGNERMGLGGRRGDR